VQATDDRLRKGQQKMRALADAIARFHVECSRATGHIRPGPALEMDHIDPVVNALDEALVAIRTIDLEVLQASDPTGYSALRKGSPTGVVVRALTAPRNNAVHDVEVIDPDLPRAIGPMEGGRCVIFPKWRQRSSLPPAMFQHPKGRKKSEIHVDYATSYDSAAAGRLVLDTLMDAFTFFDGCDPRLADRDGEGNLRGFPLAPLPIAGYTRLAPDWPDQETVDHNIRERARDEIPAGVSREISGWVSTSEGGVFCGYTNVDQRRRHSFTELGDQVRRDIDNGFPYVAVTASDECLDVSTVDGELHAGGVPIGQVDLRDWTSSSEPWLGWWGLCTSDASYYRDQRRAV
jgi:hypothetical protein